jgi:hypothetical protein
LAPGAPPGPRAATLLGIITFADVVKGRWLS